MNGENAFQYNNLNHILKSFGMSGKWVGNKGWDKTREK